jgi:mono/diheme cytochrome c family protein
MPSVRLFASAIGAALMVAAGAPAYSQQGPTYSQEISRIFQAKCQTCHRDGDIAPFALATYDDAVTWAQDIQTSVSNGTMPPWKPVPGYGDFQYSLALTADEKQAILDWVGNGTPQGDPADLPDPLTDTGP